MKVVIASDHAGYMLKTKMAEHLRTKGLNVIDMGVDAPERCDYPDYALKVATAVSNKEADWGLLVCGTGIGMSMSANKVSGVRAAVVSDPFCAAATRQHNDANVLCLGERVVGVGLATAIVDNWCAAEFEGGRHADRLKKMMSIEVK